MIRFDMNPSSFSWFILEVQEQKSMYKENNDKMIK